MTTTIRKLSMLRANHAATGKERNGRCEVFQKRSSSRPPSSELPGEGFVASLEGESWGQRIAAVDRHGPRIGSILVSGIGGDSGYLLY